MIIFFADVSMFFSSRNQLDRIVSLVFNLYDCFVQSHKAWIPEDDSNKITMIARKIRLGRRSFFSFSYLYTLTRTKHTWIWQSNMRSMVDTLKKRNDWLCWDKYIFFCNVFFSLHFDFFYYFFLSLIWWWWYLRILENDQSKGLF